MDHRYSIISDCLGLVRQCNMPLKKKLCVETLLYQVKRLLLKGGGFDNVCSSGCDLREFHELLSQMQAVCGDTCDQDSLADLTHRISVMLTSLGRDAASYERDQLQMQ